MLKLLVLIALVYLFIRMLLNYKASLSTTKTWKQNNRSFTHDFDLFTHNKNSFGYHQGYQGTRINPATGLPMMGNMDVCGNPYGSDLHNCGSSHGISACGGSVMMIKIKRVAGVLVLIDLIVFGSGALYALVMNTYGG